MKLSAFTYKAITPNDSTPLTDGYTDGVYVGGTGDLAVVDGSGATVVFANLAAGVVHPIRTRVIKSTGTSATGIIGLWLRSQSE